MTDRYSILQFDESIYYMMSLLEETGCPLKTERGNRVFPVSDKAVTIVDALVKEAVTKCNWDECVDLEDINNAPTIDAEPVKHGYWIGGGYDKCSVCGGMELGRTDYCPHCGAKMDRKRKEE